MAYPGQLIRRSKMILARSGEAEKGIVICLGKTPSGQKRLVSPNDSDEIIELIFEKDFSSLVDLSGDPAAN
jgi:hypothetical protein